MAALVLGGVDAVRERPIVGFGVCPVSPLKLPRDATEVIIETARLGLPDTILSMAMAGGSSPVTLAGTLVTHNAEVLAGITLAQLTERGCPVIYGSSTTAMDLRLAAASVGCAELALISAGATQLARQYRLPSYIAGA
jgi:trimethylamine--corrinoid protein Co-methyltransferase